MINALHLLWIIPLAVCVGFFFASICVAARDRKNEKTPPEHRIV